ncbi:hypothetical protein ABTD21_19970, partial [Acinetobacter baumannii]
LKSRVLLYAASDLHYLPLASTKIPELASHPKPELFGSAGGNRIERWQRARQAAQEAMNLGTGYKLDLSAKVPPEQGKLNYMS